jgi:hypothetical protein
METHDYLISPASLAFGQDGRHAEQHDDNSQRDAASRNSHLSGTGRNGEPHTADSPFHAETPKPASASGDKPTYQTSEHIMRALEELRRFHQSHKARVRYKASTRELDCAFSDLSPDPKTLAETSHSYEIKLGALEGVSRTRLALLMRDLPPGHSIAADEAFIDAVVENCSHWHKHQRSYGTVVRSYRVIA